MTSLATFDEFGGEHRIQYPNVERGQFPMHLAAWGQTPHLCQQAKCRSRDRAPFSMVALPGNDDSFSMLGIFAIGKFLQVIMHFLRSPSS